MRHDVQAGARIPVHIFDLHTRNVREKHDTQDIYTGFEAELAIREYLDKDDGAALEERLRDQCTSVGSSPPKRKKLVADLDSGEKKLAQWRIRSGLKEELKKYATETDNTYSDVFALAIREYWTNSRLDRIETLYNRLETAIEPWEDQIGSDGVNVTVQDRRATAIAMELESSFTRDELDDAITEITSDSDYNRRTYTPKVAEYKGVEEHPNNPDLFIPREDAAELRENQDIDDSGPSVFEQSFDELTPDDRVLRVRARLYQNAASGGGKTAMTHGEIVDEFDDEPGKSTVYNLMGRAAEASGFNMASPHGTKRLQVTARQVDDDDVIEAATGGDDVDRSSTNDVRSGLDHITNPDSIQ